MYVRNHVDVSAEGTNFSGGPGACTPGKFSELDSLKRHFLRSLDWKWFTGKVC